MEEARLGMVELVSIEHIERVLLCWLLCVRIEEYRRNTILHWNHNKHRCMTYKYSLVLKLLRRGESTFRNFKVSLECVDWDPAVDQSRQWLQIKRICDVTSIHNLEEKKMTWHYHTTCSNSVGAYLREEESETRVWRSTSDGLSVLVHGGQVFLELGTCKAQHFL